MKKLAVAALDSAAKCIKILIERLGNERLGNERKFGEEADKWRGEKTEFLMYRAAGPGS